jgi:hypothetical protein
MKENIFMSATQPNWLNYTKILQYQRAHALRQSEIPVEHAVSLPVPTKRWKEPGYAFFASPALRIPGRPMEQDTPDRWCVLTASGGHLILYALCEAFSFTAGAKFERLTLPSESRSIIELKQELVNLETLMNLLVSPFFAGETGYDESRKALLESLQAYLPEPLLPQYRALAPDFFAWLEG